MLDPKPVKLKLTKPADLLTYVEGINQVLNQATTAQTYEQPGISVPAVRSLVFVDLSDTPDQPAPIKGANHMLMVQGIGARKLAYALVQSAPEFADELLIALATEQHLATGQVIHREHTDD